MPHGPLMVCQQTPAPPSPLTGWDDFFPRTATALPPHALNQGDPVDYLTLLAAVPLALVVALLCATLVCVVAILRAHRSEVVAVVRALPGLVAALLRRKP